MAISESYLIIGAGVFGASTALHLKQSKPSARVVLVDPLKPANSASASSDVNKIIRADYPDLTYMKLAIEAQDAWRTDPLLRECYHEPGMLFAEELSMGKAAYDNFEALGFDSGSEMLTPDEAQARFGKWFKNANWTDVKENYFNPRSGWGDADKAMQVMHAKCLDAGVEFESSQVATLLLTSTGSCRGVTLVNGQVLVADKIVCCTGANTAKLFADSAPQNAKLQVDGRLVAAGAVSCSVRCQPEYLHLYEGAPVHFIGMHHTHGESVPPNADGILKFNFELSFTNMEDHQASGQRISIPPNPKGQSTWGHEVPVGLQKQASTVVKHVWGENAPGLEIVAFRMCWDAVTPNQDFVISPHPHCPNLYIAAGGSFHSWKFLPIIGKYVVQMIDGTLDADKSKKWAWDRAEEGAACEMYIPARDLKDIEGYGALDAKG